MNLIKQLFTVIILMILFPMSVLSDIQANVLDKLKKATVLIITESGGETKSGSGFIAHKAGTTGLVVTNAHVIVPKHKGEKVSVILNSGTAEALTLKAEILGINIDADLAVLKINSEHTPDPIQISQTPEVSETQEVFILGFPFGTMLSTNRQTPAITISKGFVSSKRRDENNQTFLIQIDGGINKGNSGGPIVTKEGELIGVAVAAIKETNIGFAIPERKVRAMTDGSLTNFELAAGKKEKSEMFITADIIDPLNRIESSSLLIVSEKDAVLSDALGNNGVWNLLSAKNEPVLFNPTDNNRVKAEIKSGQLKQSDTYYAQVILKTKGSVSLPVYQPPFRIFVKADDSLLAGPDVLPIKPESKPKEKKSPDFPPSSEKTPLEEAEEEPPDSVEIIKAPSSFEDIILAGGGKYLIFKFTQEGQLGIFDVIDNKWLKQIKIPDFDYLMAANRDKLLIGLTSRNRLMRIDLHTLKEEQSAEVPDGSSIKAMAIGWNSWDKPLLLLTSSGFEFIDFKTLAPIPYEWKDRTPHIDDREVIRLRASSNGKVFTFWGTKHSPEGINMIYIFNRQVHYQREHDTAGYLAPNLDGSLIYTNLKGIYNSKLKITGSSKFHGKHLFPSTEEKYFLVVSYEDNNPALSIRDVNTQLSVLSLNNLNEMKNRLHTHGFHRPILSEEKRFYLFPNVNKLITIPFSDDCIVIRKISIEE